MHTLKQLHEKIQKFPAHWVKEEQSHSHWKDELDVAAVRAEQWTPELSFCRTDLLSGPLDWEK